MTLNITALWDALGWAILHSLWQGAAIGFLVWAVRSLATDRHAWLRYLAGMGGLIATFAAFLATFVILTFNRAQSWSPVEIMGGSDAGASTEISLSISVLPLKIGQMTQSGLTAAVVPWLGIVWAVGFAFLSLQAYRAYATTRFLATQGLDTPNADWTARFATLITRSRTHARVRLFISDHVSGPMTLGALRPIVLVPVGFLTALPPAQVEAILLHELAHIRRHDFLFGLIQTAIRTVLYFNPAVIMISRQIDEDREKACDDIAVAVSGNPRDLVQGLAALRLGNHAPAMVMSADGGPLLGRLNRLMGRPASRRASNRLSAAAISALLLGTAACSTVSVAHPHPPVPPVSPDVSIPDTVVRAKNPKVAVHAANRNYPQSYVVSSADIPPLPVMPAMPFVPPTPVIPAVPTPVFGDYENEEAFEAAMETWGEQMEDWGDEVERRFEGDWEESMDDWGEAMDVWGEAVENIVERYDHDGLAALGALSGLVDLDQLALLGNLEEGVYIIDDGELSNKPELIRARILRDVANTAVQSAMVERQNVINAREQANRQREQAARQRAHAERMEKQAESLRKQAKERRKQAERRHAKQAERHAEAMTHSSQERSSTRTSHHTQHEITVSRDEPGNTVVINGRTLDVDDFRRTVMSALIKDGFITSEKAAVRLELCSGTLSVNGRSGTKAQAKRYAKMLAAVGLDSQDSVTLTFKHDLMSLNLSGHGRKNVQEISVGTFEHTPKK